MPSDIRVPMAPIQDAFGVAATVRRPPPDEEPIETVVAWPAPLPTDVPGGAEWARQEPKKTMGLSRSEVLTVPIGTIVEAPEVGGGTVKTWRVDGIVSVDPEETRVTVVEVPE